MFTRKAVLGAVLITIATPFPALAVDPGMARNMKDLKVSRLGDTELSCAALEKEAVAMRSIIRAKQGIEDDSNMKSNGISAAGAVGSLLLGTLTAGVGLAAAGFIANEAVEDEADRADSIKEVAAQRRSLMVGIYHAKGCAEPIDHVFDDKPARKERKEAIAMTSPTEEPRTAAPVVATIAPAAGAASPEFRFNE